MKDLDPIFKTEPVAKRQCAFTPGVIATAASVEELLRKRNAPASLRKLATIAVTGSLDSAAKTGEGNALTAKEIAEQMQAVISKRAERGDDPEARKLAALRTEDLVERALTYAEGEKGTAEVRIGREGTDDRLCQDG